MLKKWEEVELQEEITLNHSIEEQIQRVEKLVRRRLPESLASFYRTYNGYRPSSEHYELPGIRMEPDHIATFARIGILGEREKIIESGIKQPWPVCPLESYLDDYEGLPSDLFIFGDDYTSGHWAMNLQGEIFYIHPERSWENRNDPFDMFGIIKCESCLLKFMSKLK